jgi:hypothetical protein
VEAIDEGKVAKGMFEAEGKDLREMMLKINTVMDYFSNEFMRVENFMEKYLPLQVQNQISHSLNAIVDVKNRYRLKEYEDARFLELRELLLDDRGLPSLEKECKAILEEAKQQTLRFNDLEQITPPGMTGLQEDRLLK